MSKSLLEIIRNIYTGGNSYKPHTIKSHCTPLSLESTHNQICKTTYKKLRNYQQRVSRTIKNTKHK